MNCTETGALPKVAARLLIAARKWIEQGNVKAPEVDHVGGHHRELMGIGDGGDHRVFVEGVRLVMHELCSAAERRAIHVEDVERVAHLIEPEFDFASFDGVLLACDFNAGLDLADGHAGQVELRRPHRRGGVACAVQTPRWCRATTPFLELQGWAAAVLTTG